LKETVKVLFASGSEDLIPTAIEHMEKLYPELPLIVVSEFPPEHARWIPFPLSRGFRDNLALVRWHFRDKRVRLSAVILQPRMPYWRMRLVGFLLSPWNFVAFNEDFGHFMLRPRSVGTILRHCLWRTRNFFVWEFSPGGTVIHVSGKRKVGSVADASHGWASGTTHDLPEEMFCWSPTERAYRLCR